MKAPSITLPSPPSYYYLASSSRLHADLLRPSSLSSLAEVSTKLRPLDWPHTLWMTDLLYCATSTSMTSLKENELKMGWQTSFLIRLSTKKKYMATKLRI